MDIKYQLLKHFLAALAYRTQKAIRGAPKEFETFRARPGVRTPHEMIFHMTNVIGYARTFFIGADYRPEIKPSFKEEVDRFHDMLDSFAEYLDKGSSLIEMTPERILQGPFSDAMTHAGQIALLRRLYGSPIPPENFIRADINSNNLGSIQPDPVCPDDDWGEP